MVIVRLDRHEAERTDAFTKWRIKLPTGEKLTLIDAREKGIAKLIHSTATLNKTHWVEYWEVDEYVELLRIRRSSRGNISITVYKPKDLKPSEEELLKVFID